MTEDQCLEIAVEIGDRILADERHDPEKGPWDYDIEGRHSPCDPSFYMGVAGVVHFLLPLYRLTGEERFLAAARRYMEWMVQRFREATSSEKPPPSGLYVGVGGPTQVLLEMYEATGERSYLEQCLEQARWLAEQPNDFLDLMFGPAGYGLIFLDLHQVTGDGSWQETARRCLAAQQETAEPYGSGGVVWPIGRGPDRHWVTPGLAHGTAGIAFFLHVMADRDPASGAGELAAKADAALVELARERDGGLDWAHMVDAAEDRFLVQWCHGAPGVAISFLNSARKDALEIARAAGRVTVAAGDNRNQASQCHGVCGNAETFIELYRRTGEESWLERAYRFGNMALKHRLEGKGPGAFRTHDGDDLTYDLMTGIAGVGYFFLRLASPREIGYPVLGRWLPRSNTMT